jgi:hypothetical protein
VFTELSENEYTIGRGSECTIDIGRLKVLEGTKFVPRLYSYPWNFDEAWDDCCPQLHDGDLIGFDEEENSNCHVQPPYSPYLAPADFFLFPKLKSSLRGRRFQTVEVIQENSIGTFAPSRKTRSRTGKTLGEVYQEWRGILWRRI